MAEANLHHHRRAAVGGVLLGSVISALFLALTSIAAYVILDLRENVKDREEDMRRNAIYVATWSAEIENRREDIRDLQHFFPSHGHPTPNPPTTNPTVPPPPHD